MNPRITIDEGDFAQALAALSFRPSADSSPDRLTWSIGQDQTTRTVAWLRPQGVIEVFVSREWGTEQSNLSDNMPLTAVLGFIRGIVE